MKLVAFVTALTLLTIGIGVIIAECTPFGTGGSRTAAEESRPPDALLSQRLAIAYAALRDAEGARRLPEVHRYAQVAIDAIVGPTGRHGRTGAPPAGVLPEDSERIETEPGLALRAYDAATENSPLRAAVDSSVTSSVTAWRAPRSRYDAIDRAVADYRPDRDTISELPGEAERALAWALLTLKADDVNDAHALAHRAAGAARAALDAVRVARASGQ